jgi:hypothetical protein
MDMTIKSKDNRKRKIRKTPTIPSQSEVIKRINRNTRKNYKLLDLLIWSRDGYGK